MTSPYLNQPCRSEAEALADAILKAAGTGLLNYMPSSRERIIAAAQAQIDEISASFLLPMKAINDRLEWNGHRQGWDIRCDLPAGTIIALRAALAKAEGR